MNLRPGKGPARLLLKMWDMQNKGHRTYQMGRRPDKARLLKLGYIKQVPERGLTVTPEGRYAARALDASS